MAAMLAVDGERVRRCVHLPALWGTKDVLGRAARPQPDVGWD